MVVQKAANLVGNSAGQMAVQLAQLLVEQKVDY